MTQANLITSLSESCNLKDFISNSHHGRRNKSDRDLNRNREIAPGERIPVIETLHS